MKRIIPGLLIILLFACEQNSQKTKDLTDLIPADTEIVIQSDNLGSLVQSIYSLELFQSKNSKLKDKLQQELAVVNQIDSIGPSIVSLSKIGSSAFNYLLVTKTLPKLTSSDSTKLKVVENLKYKNFEIEKYTIDKQTYFISNIQGLTIVSNSLSLMESTSKGEGLLDDDTFQKIYAASDKKKSSVFINHALLPKILAEFLPNTKPDFAGILAKWTSLDIDLEENSILLNGIALSDETSNSIQNIFQNTQPVANEIARLIPANAVSYSSYTFNDFSVLNENLNSFRQDSLKLPADHLLHSAQEIGTINFEKHAAFVINSNDIEIAKEALISQQEISQEFRGIPIFHYNETTSFQDILYPLVKLRSPKYYTIIEHFVVFSQEFEPLEDIIAAYKNNSSLQDQPYYQSSFEKLSSASSMLFVALFPQYKVELLENAAPDYHSDIKNLVLTNYRVAALQFVQEDNFAHAHASFLKAKKNINTANVEQSLSIKLDNKILTKPFFFNNHSTSQMDIAIQDEQNILYLISNKGNIYWKKQLDGPIIGDINQVDILRNGKFQLAFSTANSIEVLDRTGKTVAPFPLKFKDEITQPLSIFDYENNRKYRFVVTQGDDILMYDQKGKSVKGFKFNSGNSDILSSPKHIRLGNKDYILAPDASGKLNILSRQGKPRVKVAKTINFSDNKWFNYKNRFVSSSLNGDLIRIDQKGRVDIEPLNLAENHKIQATANTLVSLSENILKIKDNEVSLDFGLYSEPQIFYVKNKIYVAITDTQAQKVYVFDSTAKLLPNFPVFGTSMIALENIDVDRKLEFAVLGGENELIIYQF